MGPKPKPSIERFWSHVERRGPDDCWNWKAAGCGPRRGYGNFRVGSMGIDRRLVMAHVFSYELHFGSLGELFCLHKCDNPRCVNPAHLFAGTQKENLLDMMKKGRGARGQRHYNAKLSAQKIELGRLYRVNGWTYCKIANRFNVSYATIYSALNGYTWKDVKRGVNQ